jgi:hypothetical protein
MTQRRPTRRPGHDSTPLPELGLSSKFKRYTSPTYLYIYKRGTASLKILSEGPPDSKMGGRKDKRGRSTYLYKISPEKSSVHSIPGKRVTDARATQL